MSCCSIGHAGPFMTSVLVTHNVLDIIGFSYHACVDVFKKTLNKDAVHYLDKLHKDSHSPEPFLHTICCINRFYTIAITLKEDINKGCFSNKNAFTNYLNKFKPLKTIAQTCQLASLILGTGVFLSKNLKVVNLTFLKSFYQFQTLLSALGCGLYLASLIWEQKKGKHNTDMIKVFYGLDTIAETLELVSNWRVLDNYNSPIGKIASVAGLGNRIIGTSLLLERLSSK